MIDPPSLKLRRGKHGYPLSLVQVYVEFFVLTGERDGIMVLVSAGGLILYESKLVFRTLSLVLASIAE